MSHEEWILRLMAQGFTYEEALERLRWEDDMLSDATNSSDLRYRMYRVNKENEK